MDSSVSLLLFGVIFVIVMILITVFARKIDNTEKLGIIHAYNDNGTVAFYVEFYDEKSPHDILSLENVTFKVHVDKEIGEDG